MITPTEQKQRQAEQSERVELDPRPGEQEQRRLTPEQRPVEQRQGERSGEKEQRTDEQERRHTEQQLLQLNDTVTSNNSTNPSKPKRKIKRLVASCASCRQRKARCDRGRPCSECFKKNLSCDYSGALSPPIVIRRRQNHEIEQEEYIKSLEARLRALQQTVHSTNDPSPAPLPEEKQDFSVDDLASQLSTITIGQRVRCDSRSQQAHPLKVQVDHLLSTHATPARTTFIQPDQQFSLNLVASNPIPSLEELCNECLPTRTDIDFLAEYFFNSINLWSSCLNRNDWRSQLDTFWNTPHRLQFRPSPSIPQPAHLTQHYLAQFLSTIYGVLAHGLLALADIHHLDSAHENRSSSASSSPNPSHESLWNLSQAEKISLANRWFRFALGLLISPSGDIYVKPTVFGVRAMSILSDVELAPENTDHGIFFWTLTCNVATSAGLFCEPPITCDETLDMLDETEIESRRWLSWHILSVDWAGHSISGGIRPRSDPDQFSVKMPGTVPSATIPFHPVDGWPLDPLVCVRRVSAINDCLMQRANNTIHNATYQDILKLQTQFIEIEKSLPSRLQCRFTADGKSLEPVVENNPIPFLIIAFLRARFCIPRIRLLRLFIFPKKGVPPEERLRQLEALLQVSKEHFIIVQNFSHNLNMHPLLMFSLVNTAVACALVLLINHQTRDLVIDEGFFLAELSKIINLFHMGKRTMAATMASKAASILQTLVKLIELRVDPNARKSLDGRKKGPGATLEAIQSQQSVNAGDEVRKRKMQSKYLATAPVESSTFEPIPSGVGIHSSNPFPPSSLGQQMQSEIGFHGNQSIGSSKSLASSAFLSFSHQGPSAAIRLADSSSMDTSQTTPPSVSPHPLLRPALSNSTSSTQPSPGNCPRPSQFNILPFHRVTRSLHNFDELSNVEFGSIDDKLTHHQFNFPIFDLFPSGENELQFGGIRPGEGTVEDSIMLSEVLNHQMSSQFQSTTGKEYHARGFPVGNFPDDDALDPFQPNFHFYPGSTI